MTLSEISIVDTLDDVRLLRTPALFFSSTTRVQAGYASGTMESANRYQLPIPNGAIISSAFLRFTASGNQTTTGLRTTFGIEDVDDSPRITDATDFDNRIPSNLFGTTVAWDDIGPWTSIDPFDGPDISVLIQAIVDRPGYVENNWINILWRDNGSGDDGSFTSFRQARDWTGAQTNGEVVILNVEWSLGLPIEFGVQMDAVTTVISSMVRRISFEPTIIVISSMSSEFRIAVVKAFQTVINTISSFFGNLSLRFRLAPKVTAVSRINEVSVTGIEVLNQPEKTAGPSRTEPKITRIR